MPGAASALGVRRGEIDVADQQLLLELGRAREQRAGVVDDEGVPVEDQLVLAADQRAEGERGSVLARALADHQLALEPLAGVVGGGREVDDQRGTGQRHVGARRTRLPDVLADRDPDAMLAELDQRTGAAGLEVALLVEDAVVGQQDLAVDARHAPVGEHRRGVVDVGGALRKADDRDEPRVCSGEAVDRRARVAQEVLLVEQVLGRVAGDRQLAEQRQVRLLIARAAERRLDRGLVGGDVAHRGIQLAERQAQRGHTTIIGHRASRPGPARRRAPAPVAEPCARALRRARPATPRAGRRAGRGRASAS